MNIKNRKQKNREVIMKNNKGFSLIEVLVTVGLVGILVGIAIPSYQGYKKRTVAMAVRADLGNGSKVYNAKYAVESTYCYDLVSVGLPAQEGRAGNPIYKKQGWFGFETINTSCGNVTDRAKYQFKATAGSCNDPSILTQSACTGMFSGMTRAWANRADLAATVSPSACELKDNEFLMGAYTDVSGLDAFLTADHEGRIGEKNAGTDCEAP